jgi:hypothetical protein
LRPLGGGKVAQFTIFPVPQRTLRAQLLTPLDALLPLDLHIALCLALRLRAAFGRLRTGFRLR